MSTPHTLAEAVRTLTSSRSDSNNAFKAVDILAFVTKIHISRQSAALSSLRQSPVKCRIWLVDDSSYDQKGGITTAQFVFYNTSDAKRLEQEKVQEGDLLRFNGVVLAKNSDTSHPCFHFTSNAEPGQGWACIGRKDSLLKNEIGVNTTVPLPGAMATSASRIRQLAEWYSTHRNTRQQPHDEQNPATAKGIASPSSKQQLSTLPCQNRQLDELHASIGILSNIMVEVTHIFSQSAHMVTSSNRKKRKRQQQAVVPALALVTVTDQTRTVMTLVDGTGRFVPQFTTAMANRSDSRLIVTNVLTKSQSSLRGIKFSCPTNEVVLVTTTETAVILVPFDRTRALSQPTQETGRFASQHYSNEIESFMIVSELFDLIIDGVSLKEHGETMFSGTSDYRKTILESRQGDDCPRFKSSAKAIFNGDSIESSFLPITRDVLKCLCGGLDSKDLITNNSLCRRSMDFLRAVLHDRVELKWTIRAEDREGNNPVVVKAALHDLPGKEKH